MLDCQIMSSKLEIFRIAAIRLIKIYLGDTEDDILLMSTCTCPDYFNACICQNLLVCLINQKKYDPDLEFRKQKKKRNKKSQQGIKLRSKVYISLYVVVYKRDNYDVVFH